MKHAMTIRAYQGYILNSCRSPIGGELANGYSVVRFYEADPASTVRYGKVEATAGTLQTAIFCKGHGFCQTHHR